MKETRLIPLALAPGNASDTKVSDVQVKWSPASTNLASVNK